MAEAAVVKRNGMAYHDLDEAEIAQRLSWASRLPEENPFPPTILDANLQRAAVLMPFLRQPDGWSLLYIRRTSKPEDRHSGQVAFPGGRMDDADLSLEATALREACEEIGLKAGDARLLGRLHDFVTVTSYRVTPVAAVMPWPYPLHPEASEVSRIFTIPLSWLADQRNRREELRHLPPPYPALPVIYYQPFDGEVLWGASARFTIRLLEILFGSE